MLRADLFVIATNLKQRKFPPIDEWIKILCCIPTKKFHSEIKILIHTTMSMDLKIIMMSERRPTKSNIYCMISLI